MKKYKLTIEHKSKIASGDFIRSGNSQPAVIAEWLINHPNTRIIHIEEICECPQYHNTSNGMTPRRWRNHHKARITQMRNNAQSLMTDEDAVLTIEERIQLSRIACQFDRILSLWTERSLELSINTSNKQ